MAFQGSLKVREGDCLGNMWEWVGEGDCHNCGRHIVQTIQAKKSIWPKGLSDVELKASFEERVLENHSCERGVRGFTVPTRQEIEQLSKPVPVRLQ